MRPRKPGIGHTLSSTSQRSYWLGRYLERAESTARLIIVNANLLLDLPVRLPLGWRPLVHITGSEPEFDKVFKRSNERNVVRFLISDLRNPASLFSSLNLARENARTLRGRMPRAAFEYVNELVLYSRQSLSEPLSRTRRVAGLSRVMQMIQQIDGFLSGNMLHDALWGFLRIGNFIERADMLSRIVDLHSTDILGGNRPDPASFQDVQWRSVLESLSALQSYNATRQGPIDEVAVLNFLFKSPSLPRSYLRCLNQIRYNLRSLPRNERPLQAVNRLRREIEAVGSEAFAGDRLHGFVDDRQQDLAELHNTINRTYFDFKPRLPRA